jgi:pimeloyl-ACP methyl ester carboxylesterase
MGERWFEGMGQGNVQDYRRAAQGIDHVTPGLTVRSSAIRSDPDAMITRLLTEVQSADFEVISDAGIRTVLRNNFREAFRRSADGWIDDILAFTNDWGFDLQDISVPVLLWHGHEDIYSPMQHSRWLHRNIPNSILRIEQGKAHFDALAVLPDLLPWLTSG